jgi:hypothetical protein
MKGRRQRSVTPKAPDIRKAEVWHDLVYVCRCCAEETGETHSVRESMIDPSLLADSNRLRHGICQKCMAWVEKGHTIIIAEPDNMEDTRQPRAAILTLEGTATLHENARGVILRVPLDEFLKRFPDR